MTYISKTLRRKIADAANHQCGYCLTNQKISGAQMHLEHVIPRSLGDPSDESNLWLACAWCNSYKGVQTHATDTVTQQETPLFNPITQNWFKHFRWSEDGLLIIGLTAIGRATVEALQLNNEYIVPARRHWVLAGWHPPTQ